MSVETSLTAEYINSYNNNGDDLTQAPFMGWEEYQPGYDQSALIHELEKVLDLKSPRLERVLSNLPPGWFTRSFPENLDMLDDPNIHSIHILDAPRYLQGEH